MQAKSPSSLKVPTFSTPNTIYKGVIALPRKPYRSFRSRSFSLTPFTQTNLVNACSNYQQNSNSPTGIKTSYSSLNQIPIFYDNDPNDLNISPSIDLNNELFESKVQPFPDIADPEFDIILKAKLDICSYIFDFHNDDQIDKREIKTETLEQFAALFQDKNTAILLNPYQSQAIFRMIERNIFRKDPKFPKFTPIIEHSPPFSESFYMLSASYSIYANIPRCTIHQL